MFSKTVSSCLALLAVANAASVVPANQQQWQQPQPQTFYLAQPASTPFFSQQPTYFYAPVAQEAVPSLQGTAGQDYQQQQFKTTAVLDPSLSTSSDPSVRFFLTNPFLNNPFNTRESIN
jgi:hypothetical protein